MPYGDIFLFVILFMLSAFFSGSETALMSIPKHKIESLVKSKASGALSLKAIKKCNDRLLITILIGNNLVNVYTAALATQIAIELAENSGVSQAQFVGISTGIVTFLLLIFGEIAPKSFATKNATNIALIVAPFYRFIGTIFFPIIYIVEIFVKLFSGKKNIEKITDSEIESFLDIGKENGGINNEEHEKMMSILDFNDIVAEEIMTPRVKLDAISDDFTINEAIEYYLNHTHTRIPIYHKTIDKIDYFVSARDLLKELSLGHGDKKISDIKLRKVLKVPLNQPISRLFKIFQKSSKVFAIIMDQYGGVAGLVSAEDIVEQVFGEIRDEFDRELEEFVKGDKGEIITDSIVLMQDLLEEFDLELENIGLDEKEFDGETVSYIITDILETFPKIGEEISFKINQNEENNEDSKEFVLKVLEVDEAKIGKVEAKIIEKKEEKKEGLKLRKTKK